MNSGVIQLLVLAAVAIFLILKLKNVLGTRDGFEKPQLRDDAAPKRMDRRSGDLSVVEGGLDRDIADHVKSGTAAADALSRMKLADPKFSLGEFLAGAKGAYEMILMAFERGELDSVQPFISEEVYASLNEAVEERKSKGLKIEASFVGLREIGVADAEFDPKTGLGEVTVKFLGELTSVIRNADGDIVEGNPNEVKRQRDVWTFARKLGSDDPNWQLVATSE